MKYSGLFLLTLVKHQFHFYREMVGWRTCFISLNGDLFRTISHVLLFTVFPYTPIGICQHKEGETKIWSMRLSVKLFGSKLLKVPLSAYR